MPIRSRTARTPLYALDLHPRHERFKVYTPRDLRSIPQIARLPESSQFEMEVVASVLPFRVNEYVISELIDWERVPEDPIFQLVFPQRGMLKAVHYNRMAMARRSGLDRTGLRELANAIRADLNPHPAGQLELNLPCDATGAAIPGL